MPKLIWVIAGLICCSVGAQDGMQLLRDAEAKGRSLKTYELEYVSIQEFSGGVVTQKAEFHWHLYGSVPGKFRRDVQDVKDSESFTLWDGTYEWEYDGLRREYKKTMGFRGNWLGVFTAPFEGMKSARITGQESLDVNGTPVLVTVIEGERAYNYAGKEDCHQSKAKFWIDMERKVALKSSDEWSCGAQFVRHTEITRKVVINPELSDSLFKFKPPEGAIEVREFSRGVKPKTVGQGTPDFQLKDAAGAYLGPAAWRGKIVVLWFASDDMHDELQFLELLHRALGSRDLVAIAVAHELNAPWLRDFSDEGYTVPVATDPGMAASKALGMDSTPGWAVLDRDGTILAVGSASCRQIAMVLKKAGVW